MQRARPVSAMEQAMLSIALGLLSTLLWLLVPAVHPGSSQALALWMGLLFLTTVGTIIASVWFGYDLRIGIESERWPQKEIEHFRSIFGTPLVRGAHFALALGVVFFGFYALRSGHHFRGSGSGLFILLQSFSQVLMAAQPRKPRIASNRVDWRNAPRITSDHWGKNS